MAQSPDPSVTTESPTEIFSDSGSGGSGSVSEPEADGLLNWYFHPIPENLPDRIQLTFRGFRDMKGIWGWKCSDYLGFFG